MLAMGQNPAISLSVAGKKRDEDTVAIAAGIDPLVQARLDRIEAEQGRQYRLLYCPKNQY